MKKTQIVSILVVLLIAFALIYLVLNYSKSLGKTFSGSFYDGFQEGASNPKKCVDYKNSKNCNDDDKCKWDKAFEKCNKKEPPTSPSLPSTSPSLPSTSPSLPSTSPRRPSTSPRPSPITCSSIKDHNECYKNYLSNKCIWIPSKQKCDDVKNTNIVRNCEIPADICKNTKGCSWKGNLGCKKR